MMTNTESPASKTHNSQHSAMIWVSKSDTLIQLRSLDFDIRTTCNMDFHPDMEFHHETVNMDQPPPPYPYPGQQLHQQQPPPKVVSGQPIVAPKVDKNPEVVTCPNCRAEVRTRVERSLSQNGWIWSLVLWYDNC